MPNITLEKLSNLLIKPATQGFNGSHHFIKMEPEEGFRALYETTKQLAQDLPVVYYDGTQASTATEPFFPLMTELKKQLLKPDYKGVYSLHKELWESFFQGEAPQRSEPLLHNEKHYEEDKFKEDYLKLWEQRPSQPRIVFVDKVHKLSPTLWQSLTVGMTTPKKQVWVWFIPQDFQPEDPRSKALWEDFLLSIENRVLEYKIPDFKVDIRGAETRVKPDFATLLTALELCYNFLDFYQSGFLAKEALQLTFSNPSLLSTHPKEYLRVLEILGEAQSAADHLDSSLLTYSQALNFAQENGHPSEAARLLARIALVHDKRNHYAAAQKSLLQAWHEALEIPDQDLQADILFHFYYLSMDESFFLENYSRFKDLQKRFIARGEKNHQSALQTLTSFIMATLQKESLTQAVHYCEEGIALAEELKNKYTLSVGYHCRGVIAQSEQNYALALDFYQKSEKIRRYLGDKTELIKICNGTGFFCLLTQQFEPALVYFGKALKLLEDHRDFREMGMTIFNMGMVYFFSYHHDKALAYFQNLLSLMNILDMENLPYQSRRQIHSLIGLCQFKLGQTAVSWQSFYKAEQHQPADDPIHSFFFSLLKAQLTASSEDWNQAFSHTQSKNYAILAYYFASEWGLFNKEVLKTGRQIEIWESALGEISLFEGPFYGQRFQDLLENKKVTEPSWKIKDPSFPDLLEMARQEKTILRLQKKIGEMNFLASLAEHLQGAKDQESLLAGALTLIRQSFIVETGFIALKNPSGTFEVNSHFALKRDMDALKLHNLLFTHSSPQYFPRISHIDALKEFHGKMESLVFLPLVHNEQYLGGLILGSTTRSLGFSEEELAPLGIAALQMASELDFLSHQVKLEASNPKDELTGLTSRHQLRRIPIKQKTGVIYIHLDNFRSYNDRYGRAVGDLVLQKFAGLLHIASRQEDLVVRYGGVEFVILVPETGLEGAKKVAERVLKEMKNRKNFQEALETFLGRPLKLNEQDQLSCSIGLSEMQGTQSLEEALAKVKTEGKGNYLVL